MLCLSYFVEVKENNSNKNRQRKLCRAYYSKGVNFFFFFLLEFGRVSKPGKNVGEFYSKKQGINSDVLCKLLAWEADVGLPRNEQIV